MSNPSLPVVSADGTIQVPSFRLPLSAALSAEAAASQARVLSSGFGVNLTNLDMLETEAEFRSAVDAFRSGVDQMFALPLSEKLLAAFPVNIRAAVIGGVAVEEFTPDTSMTPDAVLINLHGGAFYSGAIHIARVESIPVAHIGKFRVVSVDYRQGYEHKYPAASEDVAAVYAELLKSYAPERIGIYGGSAGGTLTLQATAWILQQGMPAPAAIGVFGAGASGSGDGSYFSAIGTAQPAPIDVSTSVRGTRYGYFAGADRDDVLINLILADQGFRAKFPPCLFITGTRAFDLSPAIATHRSLSQAGVEASLHVFDGMGHCFYYDASLPEAADAYATIIRFFRKNLSLPRQAEH